jgi:hypothetical protein
MLPKVVNTRVSEWSLVDKEFTMKHLNSLAFAARLMTVSMLLVSLMSGPALSAIGKVPRSEQDFDNYNFDKSKVVRVATVKVVAVDYPLIAKDFPQMRQTPHENEVQWKTRVDQWVISETGFIAQSQTQQNTVNSPIDVTSESKIAMRPAGYNRAHIIGVENGLMDAKGVGTKYPMQKDHGNGLATLGEMIREFLYEKAVTLIFEHADVPMKTVGCYAVLDYGFDVIHADGSRSRAGYVLRQAHQRSALRISTLPIQDAFQVEKILRKYGMTSSGETFAMASADQKKGRALSYDFDYVNVQGTNNKNIIEVVDFGAFLVVDSFERDLVSNFDLNQKLLTPQTFGYIQPDPKLRVPMEQWGNLGTKDPKSDKPFIWSHELAQAVAEGRAGRDAVEQHLKNMLGPFQQRLQAVPVCSRIFSAPNF